MELLKVSNLSAYYGQIQALHAISFAMDEGSVTIFVGHIWVYTFILQ